MKRALQALASAALAAFAIQSALAQPAITIYNQQFAVVRESVPLTLTKGRNHIQYSDITTHLEPDSVILRDATGKHVLRIIEQNYRADPVSEGLLLSLYEGQTIDFQVQEGNTTKIVQGKIIRSGYVPRGSLFSGNEDQQPQEPDGQDEGSDALIEVDGKLQFGLPGKPLFPALAGDTVLKPTLDWTLETDQDGPMNAELAYVTGGMTWKADYNVVMPPTGDLLDLVGWVTMDNESGMTFENAKIKLMAGDVNKIQTGEGFELNGYMREISGATGGEVPPVVTEKNFDEYHLYTLQNPTTLRDRETKQVEFVRAGGIKSKEIFVYDGEQIPEEIYSNYGGVNQDPTFGTSTNTKVWLMREFQNTEANGLGMPLPKGRMRFYRRDDDGQLEFIGENDIDHTPKGETIRVYTGNAFDVVGDRKQTGFKVDYNAHTMTEAFNISLRNHKNTSIEARVVEHLYRAMNWDITEKSDAYTKTDAHTIEFSVQIPANGEKVVSYSVHYTW